MGEEEAVEGGDEGGFGFVNGLMVWVKKSGGVVGGGGAMKGEEEEDEGEGEESEK